MAPAAYAADPVGSCPVHQDAWASRAVGHACHRCRSSSRPSRTPPLIWGPHHRPPSAPAATGCGVGERTIPRAPCPPSSPTTRCGTPASASQLGVFARHGQDGPARARRLLRVELRLLLHPALAGYSDQHSFVVRWNDDADPNTFQLAELPYPLASSWTQTSTYELSATRPTTFRCRAGRAPSTSGSTTSSRAPWSPSGSGPHRSTTSRSMATCTARHAPSRRADGGSRSTSRGRGPIALRRRRRPRSARSPTVCGDARSSRSGGYVELTSGGLLGDAALSYRTQLL